MTGTTSNQLINATRSDRANARFHFENYQLFNRQADAYTLGRLVNELCFTLQLNAVQVNADVRQLDLLFRILRSLLTRTSPTSSARFAANEVADEFEASWTELNSSEELDRQRIELRSHSVAACELGLSISPPYFSTIKSTSPICDEAVEAVHNLLGDENAKGFFELGIIVDQAVHPPVEEFAVTFLRLQDGRQHTGDANSWNQAVSTEESLPSTSEPVEVVPLTNWLLNQWRNRLEPLIGILRLTCNLEGSFEGLTSGDETIHAVVCEIEQELFDRPRGFATVHNIRIDSRNGRAFRDGHAPVPISGIKLRLLQFFIDQSDPQAEVSWLVDHWVSTFRGRANTEGTVRSTISQLNDKIENLNLMVDGVGDGTVRLVSLPIR